MLKGKASFCFRELLQVTTLKPAWGIGFGTHIRKNTHAMLAKFVALLSHSACLSGQLHLLCVGESC